MKNYSEILAKIIYDYVKQNKQLDFLFMDKIVEIIVNDEGLNDWVKLSLFEPSDEEENNEKVTALYRYKTRQLCIRKPEDLQTIIDNYVMYNFNPNYKNTIDKTYFDYLFVSRILSHELTHANQFKDYFENKKHDLEADLLRLTLTPVTIASQYQKSDLLNLSSSELMLLYYKLMQIQSIYNKYHDYELHERQANIISYGLMNEIAKILKIESIQLLAQEKLQEMILMCYDSCESPTLYFLEKLDIDKKTLRQINKKSKKLDLEERLNLGLRISNREYKTKKLEYDDLIQKRRNIS